MDFGTWFQKLALGVLVASSVFLAGFASAADGIKGQVLGGDAPIANSTVTLWAEGADAPKQLAQTKTGEDGRFEVHVSGSQGDAILYLVATGGEAKATGGGDNPAVALITVLGSMPPAKVVINEFTTVASVWTHAQFLDGTAIKGHALGLHIAAGNVPNFVNLETGGWGGVIQDPLNSNQTGILAPAVNTDGARKRRCFAALKIKSISCCCKPRSSSVFWGTSTVRISKAVIFSRYGHPAATMDRCAYRSTEKKL